MRNCRVRHSREPLIFYFDFIVFFSHIISSSLEDVTTAHKSSSLKTIVLGCLGPMVVYSNFGVNTFLVSGRVTNGVERAVGMIPTPGKENLISLLRRSVSPGLMADCAAVTVLLALSSRCLVFAWC